MRENEPNRFIYTLAGHHVTMIILNKQIANIIVQILS